ncbi:MAG: hypothetical protein IT463_13120 [Planctomycetes bacterium]|nr:hypothetical protein [Planctomycetota bacterium]
MKLTRYGAALLLLALAGGSTVLTQDEKPAAAPVELGAVAWQRDFEAGRKQAAESGKPLFVLFQEVPG